MWGTGDESYKRIKKPLVPFNAVATSDGNGAGTTLIALGLADRGTGDDFFNNFRIVLTSGTYDGWMADIVDYDATTGTFTINPGLGEIIVEGTRFGLVAKWALYNWIITGYDSTATIANDDGSVLERLEYVQEVLKPFDIAWIFGNMLVDADQFDFPADPADTERWTPEDIDGTEGVADIDTTTAEKLYMAILSPSMSNEYAVARELPILMRHFAFQSDVDFTWGTVTGTAMRGGIMASKGATYDVLNMVRVYKEKSSGEERIVADAWFNGVAQTAVQINTTDDVLAFRIERNGDIWRCYYSLDQGDDIVWLLITQFEDPTQYMTETVSFYFDIYSAGGAGTETIIMDADNFFLFNTFGAFADRIGNPLETQSGPGAAGSVHSKLRGIMSSLGIVAAAGTGFEVDGTGTDLYEAVVGVTEDTGAAGWLSGAAHESIADMPEMNAVLQGMPTPHVDQDSIRVAQLSLHNLRTDATLAPTGERTGTVISIERYRVGVDADWNAIATPGVTEAAGYDHCSYDFPGASWQNGDLIRYRAHSCVLTIGAAGRQTFYVPELTVYGVVGGIAAIMAKLNLLQEVFWMSDWDDFALDIASVVDSVRWAGENYVEAPESSNAVIASGVATVTADPDGATATGWWLRHKPVRVSKHFTAIVDLDSDLVDDTDETLAGMIVTKGVALDADNHMYIARRKEGDFTVDDLVVDGVIATAAQAEVAAVVSSDAVALRIDRIGNIFRFYYSLTQAPTYEWIYVAQFEDPTNAFGGDTSIALFALSAGADSAHIAIGVFDNFKYYVNISGLVEIMAGDYESSHVGADEVGSLIERLESLKDTIGAYAQILAPTDATWSGDDEWEGNALELLQKALMFLGAGTGTELEENYSLARIISGQNFDGTLDSFWQTISDATQYDIDGSIIHKLSAIINALGIKDGSQFDEDATTELWDILVSGYTTEALAVVQGAILERLELLQDVGITGNAIYTATASSVTTLTCDGLPDGADYFEGQIVVPIDGIMAGQGRYIAEYDGDDILTVAPAWPGDPGATVKFVIVPSGASRIVLALGAEYDGTPDLYDTIVTGYTTAATAVAVGSILERLQLLQQAGIVKNTIWTATASSDTTLTDSDLLDVANAYIGQIAIPLSGDMEGHGRYISDYDDTEEITVTPPWAADPGTVDFIIVPSDLSIVYEAIAGAAGILLWPAAAIPAANVPLAAVISYIYSEQFGTEFDGSPDLYDVMVTGYTAAANAVAQGAILERLELLQDVGITGNTVYTATASAVGSLTCDALPDGVDYFVGQMVVPITGIMAGQGRYITAYDGDDIISVSPDWPGDPGATVKFVMVPSEMSRLLMALGSEFDGTPDVYDAIITGWTGVATAVAVGSLLERLQLIQQALIGGNTIFTSSAATVNTVTAAALVDRVDLYEGMMLVPMTGDQAGQGRYIVDYNDTDVLTVIPDWSTDPDAAGAFTFVIVPTPMKFVYEAGKGLEAIFDIVDGVLVLTRVGGTHDQSDAAGTEDTLFISDAPGAIWNPDTFMINLTEMVAVDDLDVKIYYRMTSGGDYILQTDENFLNGQDIDCKDYELRPNLFGVKITTTQNAGAARDWLWEVYYGG